MNTILRCGAVLLTLLPPAVSSAADDALLARGVSRLFEVGWDASPSSRDQADGVAAKIDELFPGDPRGEYAYSLVLTRQRRYAEAAENCRQALASQPDDIALRQSHIRLLMINRDYEAALGSMALLAESASPAAAGDEEKSRQGAARFLGSMFGYLEGPAAGEINADVVDARRAEVQERLGAGREVAFLSGRRDIRSHFSSLSAALVDAEAQELAGAERDHAQTLRDIDTEQAQLDPRRTELLDQRKELQNELQEELEELAGQDRPLAAETVRIETRSQFVRRELNRIFITIDSLQAQARNPRAPAPTSILIQLDRWQEQAVRYNVELSGLESRGVAVNSQRAQLRLRAAQSSADAAARIAAIDKEIENLDKQEKVLSVQENKTLKRTPTGKTGVVRRLEAELRAFSTYDEFPLETEKARLLAELNAP